VARLPERFSYGPSRFAIDLVIVEGKILELDEFLNIPVMDGVSRGFVPGVKDTLVGVLERVVFFRPEFFLFLDSIDKQHDKSFFGHRLKIIFNTLQYLTSGIRKILNNIKFSPRIMNASHQYHHPWTRAESVLKKYGQPFWPGITRSRRADTRPVKKEACGRSGKRRFKGYNKSHLGGAAVQEMGR
jgi:hypothetical protein